MAALQGIKRRIRSVRSTRQITKAMQLVAASKLRRAEEAAHGPSAYTEAIRDMVMRLGQTLDTSHHPLFAVRPVKRTLTIFVGSDRGLAGPYNSNLNRALAHRTEDTSLEHSVICVGKRAAMVANSAADLDQVAAYVMDVADPDITIAQPALREAVELFTSGKVDQVHLIYTRFYSTIRQEVTVGQLLPLTAEKPAEGERPMEPEAEPSPEALLEFATMRLLEARILQAILQARASEQAARMIAMMNASDNARDLIDDLTLSYNNARQAGITQELAEISGGAEAMNE